jgi:thiamine biosynthesis protein ThiI
MKALLLLSGGIDSPVAGWLVKKRMEVLAVHFSLEPYTNNEPESKARELAGILGFKKLFVINIAEDVREITEKCDRKYYFILMKRLMFRKAGELARKEGCEFLVTGENLGQVSSQTLENLFVIGQAVEMPVLRPLIAMDKEDIIRLAMKIGSFESSKGREMCDVLGPEHPSTRARPEIILAQERLIGRKEVKRLWQDADSKAANAQSEETGSITYTT